MNDQMIADRAVYLIAKEPHLAVFLSAPPQAVVMPFAKARHRKYLTVVVFVIEAALNLETLAFVCSTIIKELSEEMKEHLGGLEIMPCVIQEGQTRRVLRLSVLSESLLPVALSAEDLRKEIPAEGSTCKLYIEELTARQT